MKLSLEAVNKTFSSVKAVDNLSFSVDQGEIFALLGPNGAGKTTTVRMIMQILQPDSGYIRFHPGMMDNGRVLRHRLGYLPEERGLYQEISAIKNLTYLAGLRGIEQTDARKTALSWLEKLDLSDRAEEKVSALSKGNQQKVQFIASVMHNPEFAVLDEPFSGFDPINQERICSLIMELREQGMTILLSAHQMQLVERIADRILLMGQGRELLSGTMPEIRRKTISSKKLMVEYHSGVVPSMLAEVPGIQELDVNGDGSISVYMTEDADLNSILAALGEMGKIANLHTLDISLHEIYLHSFRNGSGPDGNAPVTVQNKSKSQEK